MIISFTSDFGLADGWVGVCHGVMLAIAEDATIVDIAHQLPPYDLRHAAVVLAASLPGSPSAVDVAVVDPGVGSARRRVAVRAAGRVLVGPDNGIFAPVLERLGGAQAAYEITRDEWWLSPVSPTFEARDIFCPVAARIACGLDPSEVGPPIDRTTLAAAPWRQPVMGERSVVCEIVDVDHFGSVRLGIDAGASPLPDVPRLRLVSPVEIEAPVGATFSDVLPGGLVWMVDSSGFWTLAAREASAAEALGIAAGETVHLTW